MKSTGENLLLRKNGQSDVNILEPKNQNLKDMGVE